MFSQRYTMQVPLSIEECRSRLLRNLDSPYIPNYPQMKQQVFVREDDPYRLKISLPETNSRLSISLTLEAIDINSTQIHYEVNRWSLVIFALILSGIIPIFCGVTGLVQAWCWIPAWILIGGFLIYLIYFSRNIMNAHIHKHLEFMLQEHHY
jgi:hypothetical protein